MPLSEVQIRKVLAGRRRRQNRTVGSVLCLERHSLQCGDQGRDASGQGSWLFGGWLWIGFGQFEVRLFG
ncbi:hypothetical protein [Mesorhizobium sp. M0276]|uniref:hypothetical protein n=1 Tax=Mesorhizobium sp. M0276 TaxID=2956928 RepID=UPI003336D4FE